LVASYARRGNCAGPGGFARWAADPTKRKLAEIRIRAERECGKLLKDADGAKGAREPGTSRGATPWGRSTASTLGQMGLSRDQSSQFQKLADVPDDVFERRLANPYGRIARTFCRARSTRSVERCCEGSRGGEGAAGRAN
jgi:hypothetical protein